jgi:hypothetical protein
MKYVKIVDDHCVIVDYINKRINEINVGKIIYINGHMCCKSYIHFYYLCGNKSVSGLSSLIQANLDTVISATSMINLAANLFKENTSEIDLIYSGFCDVSKIIVIG